MQINNYNDPICGPHSIWGLGPLVWGAHKYLEIELQQPMREQEAIMDMEAYNQVMCFGDD